MSFDIRVPLLLIFLLPVASAAFAQEASPVETSVARGIYLDVTVTPKTGPPVSGLQASDFTLMDNKAGQPITSFRSVSMGQEAVHVTLLLDAVNARFDTVAFERGRVQEFLRADGGRLSHPTRIAILTDRGTQIQQGFSTDGNALSEALEHYTSGLREITRAAGVYGAEDRLQISLNALSQLAANVGPIQGRNILLWISPGWPILSGPGIDLNAKQQEQIFRRVVSFSSTLRHANLTLYMIDPLGPGESLVREDYYMGFEKGVSKASQVNLGNLSLQVLSTQSGGLVANTDVAKALARYYADLDSWYEISFEPRPEDTSNAYHHVEVKLDKPGLTARTRDGYYAKPREQE